jgi:uncharacterized protein YkwD
MQVISALAHFIYPRYSNDHKARLLHSSTLAIISGFLILYQFVLFLFPLSGVKVLGYAANISTDEVIRLTNVKRAEAGVPALAYNPTLALAAKAKGDHMLQYDYWAHVAPDGTDPWKFFADYGYRYRYAGENLARDFSDPSSAVEAWMASPTHRDNLLSTKYREIGIAVVEGDLGGVDTTIIVQFFGTPLSDTASQTQVAEASQILPTATIAPTPTVSLTATPILTPTPEAVATVITPEPTNPASGSVMLESLPPIEEEASVFEVLISPFATTKSIAIATTVLLLTVLVIDVIVVGKKNLSRVGGRTIAHMAFFGMILTIILIIKAGKIL